MSLATDSIKKLKSDYARGDHGAGSKPSDTSDQVSKLILKSTYSLNGLGELNKSASGTYSFPEYSEDDKIGSKQFTVDQQAQAKLSLQSWSDVANIKFTELTGEHAREADIKFGFYKTASGGNYTSYESTSDDLKSTIWISGNPGYDASSPKENNYGRYTLTHEIGHALGFSHPGNYDASDSSYPTYNNTAAYYEDDFQYSVMSYFNEQNTGADYKGAWSSGPQLDDITAIQDLYGSNTTTRTGDTVYGFHSNTDRDQLSVSLSHEKIVAAIWDAGGNDTFDFSGYSQDQRINLNASSFSDVGGLKGNISIAAGVTIENAIGGAGNDVLIGNDAANRLEGGRGDDILYGGLGPDQLKGGAGHDTFIFSSIADSTAATPDLILDFTSGQDKIDLSSTDVFANHTLTLQYVDAFTGKAGQTILAYDAGTHAGSLAIDFSGDAHADFGINLVGQVTQADIVA